MATQEDTLTAIVTGGSSGYGKGIARVLSEAGYTVWITGRNQAKLDATANELGVHALQSDASSSADWKRLIDTVLKESGSIDALINNAGSGGKIAPVEEQTDETINETIQSNLTGPIYGCREVVPHLKAQKSGSIINVSSVCAQYAWPTWSIYSAAKAGLDQFTKSLYLELRTSGVNVTTLTPSWGTTEFNTAADLGDHNDEILKQCTKPEELGQAVLHILQTPAHLNIHEYTITPTVQAIEPM